MTTTQRRVSAFPEPGDTVSSFAARHFPGDEDAARRVLSWNMHLVTRRSVSAEKSTSADPSLLCTDIVYVEPPLPPA